MMRDAGQAVCDPVEVDSWSDEEVEYLYSNYASKYLNNSYADRQLNKVIALVQKMNEPGGANNLDEYINALELMSGHIKNCLDIAYDLKNKEVK